MRKPPRRHPGQARKSRAAPPPARTVELEIESVGARGDGLARLEEFVRDLRGGVVLVSLTPGGRVTQGICSSKIRRQAEDS